MITRRKIKTSKRNLKPFRRYDDASMGSSLSFFEWFVFFVLVGQFIFMIYSMVTLLI